MRSISYIMLLLVFFIGLSCIKIDNNRPYISGLKVNDVGTDTIYIVNGDLTITYQVADDVKVVDTKVNMVQQDNLDSGFFFLSILSVNAKDYSVSQNVVVPDSVKKDSKLFKVSVNAFDDSGNQALQVSKIINFK